MDCVKGSGGDFFKRVALRVFPSTSWKSSSEVGYLNNDYGALFSEYGWKSDKII